MIKFVPRFKRICDIMVRKAGKRDIQAIIDLLHQVDMVHHVIRPDLFKPNTTKYDEQELETLFEDDSKPIFVYDDGEVLGHAFCIITSTHAVNKACNILPFSVLVLIAFIVCKSKPAISSFILPA